MLEFQVATDQQLKKEDGVEEEVVDFSLGGLVFKSRRPTPGQTNVLFSAGRANGTTIVWKILDKILLKNEPGTPEKDRIGEVGDLRQMMFDGVIEPSTLFGGDELNGKGILDSIIFEFAGRPTRPSSASSESPKPGGQRSTGRSRSKTSSSSDSTAT